MGGRPPGGQPGWGSQPWGGPQQQWQRPNPYGHQGPGFGGWQQQGGPQYRPVGSFQQPPRKGGGASGAVIGILVGVVVLGLLFAGINLLGDSSDETGTVSRTSYTPETTEPQTTDPQTTEPQTTEPQTTEPQTTEPQTTEPETTEPQTTEPQTTEPQTTEPSSTPPSSTPPPSQEKPLPDRSWGPLPKPHSSHPSWVVLQQNRLYGYNVPAGTCPTVPNGFTSNSQWRTFTTNTLNCQHNAWKTVFQRMGRSLPKPKYHFISGPVQTPCGRGGQHVSFYCGTWDGSSYAIYMHTELIQGSNEWWRLRAFETSAHEYFHHVQMISGILYENAKLVQGGTYSSNEGSRRVELQAACIAGRQLVQTKATAWTRRDYEIYEQWSNKDQDERHGSASSNRYWWQRGLYMPKTGGCNTWVVNSASVR